MKILTKKTKLKRAFNSGSLPTNNLNSSIGGDTPDNNVEGLTGNEAQITFKGDVTFEGNVSGISAGAGGIYAGSGTISEEDTVVTIPADHELTLGSTKFTPSAITVTQDVNHWGTYDGWDRATYSYGGHSGYYFIRGNGTAASKTALNIDDVMHEWTFTAQKSPTEENYALILKPTVDENSGGNLYGRLDFQGADFQTWLSLRRTGIRAGTSANYTTLPATRPVANSFYQHNSNGTGTYVAATEVARPYKVYTALLAQSGTSAPVATVLENTLGGTIVWTRSTPGVYTGTLVGAFVTNKTFINAKTLFDDSGVPIKINVNFTTDAITLSNTGGVDFPWGGATINGSYPIEIRVYN